MAFIETEERLQAEILDKISRGESVYNRDELPLEFMHLLEATIITQWNCEWHGGINYLNCAHLATPDEEMAVIRIGYEELGHANILRRGPLKILAVNPWSQYRHNVKEQPKILKIFQFPEKFTSWAHFLMFNHLQDRSAAVQLTEFKKGPFAPWSIAISEIELEEAGHIMHGVMGIKKLARTEEGRIALQMALDDWLPLALDVFGAPDEKSKSLELYRKYGLKKSNDESKTQFKIEIKPLLDEIGISSSLLSH